MKQKRQQIQLGDVKQAICIQIQIYYVGLFFVNMPRSLPVKSFQPKAAMNSISKWQSESVE